MKNNKIIYFLLVLAGLFFASCESDEVKYSGTPVGNQQIITLQGVITTPITDALPNQKVPFTVELPRAFKDTVNVEVTTLSLSGTRTRVSVEFLPNETVVTDDIPAVGGAIFNNTFEMYISGFNIRHTEPGIHYLIESNRITINTGNSAVPGDDSSKFQVSMFWPNSAQNDFRIWVDKPNGVSYESAPGATNSGNVVTVGDTSGLRVGMVVTVSSGTGQFRDNTMVAEILSATTFRTTLAPTAANSLGNNAIVTGGGENVVLTGLSSSVTTPTEITLTNGTTDGLLPGMTLAVVNGVGEFGVSTPAITAIGPRIVQILSPTSFRVTRVLTPLSNATVVFTVPDGVPTSSAFSIANSKADVSAGTSSTEGEYTFKILPRTLAAPGADLPYRIVWKFPNGSVGYYNGVFEGATLSSISETVLKVTKSGNGPSATYTVVSVFP